MIGSGCLVPCILLQVHSFYLPPGFKIEIYASVPNARSMALGANGTVFVGTLSEGKVHAITQDKGVKRVVNSK